MEAVVLSGYFPDFSSFTQNTIGSPLSSMENIRAVPDSWDITDKLFFYKIHLPGPGIFNCGSLYADAVPVLPADLCHRVGLSEYLAFIFIPVLIAGIYDFFVYGGRKTWLMGIGFAGLLLSHTIMTFIGVILTVLIFVRMLFVLQGESLFIRYGTYAETICYGGSSDSLYRILYVSHVRADDFGNISIHDSMGEGRRLCTALFYIF